MIPRYKFILYKNSLIFLNSTLKCNSMIGCENSGTAVGFVLFPPTKMRSTNGLIRQYFPKDRDFRTITDKEIIHATKRLNNRPRKRLGYKTPNEVFFGESDTVALTT
jgi:hypothetical protein